MVSVPWPVTPEVIREVVALGIPVLAETPPAPDAEGLRELWADVGSTGLVQVAEHSPFHAVARGPDRGGRPDRRRRRAYRSRSTHLYHAVALIRRFLDAGRGRVVVRASSFTAPLLDPLARDGWTGATEPATRWNILATLDFGDGRSALYDFTDNQWHNPLRTNRIVVRGSLGEIVDDTFTRWVDERTVLSSTIERRVSGLEQNLDGFDLEHLSLDGRVLYRNVYNGARLSDDDIAVAGAARRDGRVGARRRAAAVPAGRRLPGPPARPGDRGGGRTGVPVRTERGGLGRRVADASRGAGVTVER